MSEQILTAEIRTEKGKGCARKLRREGKVPGIYYIHGKEPIPFTVNANILSKTLASKPTLLSLELNNGKKHEAIIREVQRDPVTSVVQHIDLLGVVRGEKITVTVPVHLVGVPKGIKAGGILEHIAKELPIECLPKDLPQFLEIDVSDLELGHSLHVRDLHFEHFKILAYDDVAIANVSLPKAAIAAEAAEAAAEAAKEEVKVEEQEKKPEE
jgi:large subunit ribosomal protein L25